MIRPRAKSPMTAKTAPMAIFIWFFLLGVEGGEVKLKESTSKPGPVLTIRRV
jgi:hypothetical protein